MNTRILIGVALLLPVVGLLIGIGYLNVKLLKLRKRKPLNKNILSDIAGIFVVLTPKLQSPEERELTKKLTLAGLVLMIYVGCLVWSANLIARI